MNFLTPFRRLLRYRLIIPMLRGQNLPEYTARGCGFGLALALTPLVGVQMPLVAAVWSIVRLVRPSLNFNLVVALAWTWTTNVFTVPPVYYVFLQTGNLMLGRWGSFSGFGRFSERLDEILNSGAEGFDAIWLTTVAMVDEWGLPMFVGCVPWMVVGGWFGYKWSLVYLKRFGERRRLKQTENLEKRRAVRATGGPVTDS